MEIVHVDHLHAEAREAGFARWPDALGPAINFGRRTARAGNEPELARQHDLVSAPANRPADERLVRALAVRVGRIEERHAEIERTMDRADGFVVVAGAVALRHAHAAQADRRNCRSARAELPLSSLLVEDLGEQRNVFRGQATCGSVCR